MYIYCIVICTAVYFSNSSAHTNFQYIQYDYLENCTMNLLKRYLMYWIF